MILLSLLLLIISSYSDLRNRGISVMLPAAFLTSDILLLAGVHIFGGRYEILKRCLVYEMDLTNIACGLLPGAVLFVISLVTKEAVGRGDVILIMLLGLMLGPEKVFGLLVLSMVLTAVFGIGCMVLKRKSRKDTLPYIPFILGAFLVMMAADPGSWKLFV